MTVSPSPARRRLPPAQRRSLILSAAAQVFGERGYAAGGIDAIGARMGISGAAIYRHFARKEELLLALLDDAVTRMLAVLDEAVRADGHPADLAGIVRQMVRRAGDERTTLRLIHGDLVELSDADRARVRVIGERLMAPLVAAMRAARPALSPDAATLQVRACFAVLGGFATSVPTAFEPASRDTTERVLLAILEA